MTHISVASPKGGVGKTIVALNLAAAFARAGRRVCLVDRDPQASALVFGRLAERAGVELPFVPTNARVSGFDLYIHDHPPGLADSYPSQIVVMPTLLDAPSFLIHRRGVKHLTELGLTVLPVASRYRSDRMEQRRLVNEHFPDGPILRDRAAYPNCYGKGLTVVDARGIAYLANAQLEIKRLRETVEALLRDVAP